MFYHYREWLKTEIVLNRYFYNGYETGTGIESQCFFSLKNKVLRLFTRMNYK